MAERIFLRIAHCIRDFCAVYHHGEAARRSTPGRARANRGVCVGSCLFVCQAAETTDIDDLRYSPDDPHYGPGPVHTSLYLRVA